MTMTTTAPRAATLPAEADVLTAFWDRCRLDGADRLALVREVANVRVSTPANWSVTAVRAAFVPRPLPATGCFTCYHRSRPLAWHHLVAIAHGGSNGIWNQVALCDVCHRRLFPWLDNDAQRGGWSTPRDIVTHLAEANVRYSRPRRQVHDDEGHDDLPLHEED